MEKVRCEFVILEVHLHGRFSRGAQLEIIVMAPLMMPAEPNPAMARPTINMSDETAAPHSTEPNSKMAKKVKKDHLFSFNLAWEPQ